MKKVKGDNPPYPLIQRGLHQNHCERSDRCSHIPESHSTHCCGSLGLTQETCHGVVYPFCFYRTR